MSWLGEIKEQTWRLSLAPDAVFRRVEKNTEPPFREGGAMFSSGRIVSQFDRRSFRLHVTSIIGGRGSPIPQLRAEVRDDGDGSALTFRIQISPHSVVLWLPGLVMAGMVGLCYLAMVLLPVAQGRPDDATGIAIGGLFCVAAILFPMGLIHLFTILRARSMSAQMMGLMLDLFERDRVPNDETAPPES